MNRERYDSWILSLAEDARFKSLFDNETSCSLCIWLLEVDNAGEKTSYPIYSWVVANSLSARKGLISARISQRAFGEVKAEIIRLVYNAVGAQISLFCVRHARRLQCWRDLRQTRSAISPLRGNSNHPWPRCLRAITANSTVA